MRTGSFLLCDCVDAYLPLDPVQRQQYEELLLTEPYREVRPMVKTLYDQMRQEHRQEALRELLLVQREGRFGILSEQAKERLGDWSGDQLTALGRALLTAGSLKELGLED